MQGCSISQSAPLPDLNTWQVVDSASQVHSKSTADLITLRLAIENGDSNIQQEFEFVPITEPLQMTAYAAPVIKAQKYYGGEFAHPIRGLPEWIHADDPLPARSKVHAEFGITGTMGWVQNGLDAYLAEVNGSVKLEFKDGTTACLGWVRTNDLPYKSLGKMLAHDGHINPNRIDLEAIRRVYEEKPELVHRYMLKNDRAVFFERVNCDEWPRASTGVKLLPMACAAVDPEFIPLGSVLLIEGVFADETPFRIPVAAVDIGGAIKGHRLDLYVGDGSTAMQFAGEQNRMVKASILRKKISR